MLDVAWRCGEALTSRVGFALDKFTEFVPILTKRCLPVKHNGRTHVRSVLVYTGETWSVRVKGETRAIAEMRL